MIKGSSAIKHGGHIGNAADIPAAYILIEGPSVTKHDGHIGNATDIPATYILIEGNSAQKQGAHIANAAGAGRGGVGHVNITGRSFGIFSSTYCPGTAIRSIETENGYTIGMEGKEQFTVISTYSIYRRVARVATKAALYIIGALGIALAWGAVGAGIDGTSFAASTTTARAMRKAKDYAKEQDREGAQNAAKKAALWPKSPTLSTRARGGFVDKNMLALWAKSPYGTLPIRARGRMFFTI